MEPMSELDERFSDAGATATSWAEVRQALDSAETSWVTTVRADGRPHVTPLVAVWFDDALYFCTGPTEQKAVNLRSNQYVVLTTGCNTWGQGPRRSRRRRRRTGHRQSETRPTGRGVDDQVGRSLAFRSGQRRLPTRGRHWRGLRVRSDSNQNPQLRQSDLRSNPPPVLTRSFHRNIFDTSLIFL